MQVPMSGIEFKICAISDSRYWGSQMILDDSMCGGIVHILLHCFFREAMSHDERIALLSFTGSTKVSIYHFGVLDVIQDRNSKV